MSFDSHRNPQNYPLDPSARAFSQDQLDTIERMKKEETKCEHDCTSDCRKEGCNCDCGEFHTGEDFKCPYCGEMTTAGTFHAACYAEN